MNRFTQSKGDGPHLPLEKQEGEDSTSCHSYLNRIITYYFKFSKRVFVPTYCSTIND
jgi:hypothetical protein